MDQVVTGGCLCSAVRFEVRGPFLRASHCHCSRCRKHSGTAVCTQGRVARQSFRLLSGAELLRNYRTEGHASKVFCSVCGSSLFGGDWPDGEEVSIRLGALDGDPGIRPQFHTFVESRAPWDSISDGLPQHAGVWTGEPPSLAVSGLDHVVLTVQDAERTCEFYRRVLGMAPVTFGAGRRALRFGAQKLNLHEVERPVDRNVLHATLGSADLCFLTPAPMPQVLRHLESCAVKLVEGPIRRTGALGPILSVYFYDPDENLIELSNQLPAEAEVPCARPSS